MNDQNGVRKEENKQFGIKAADSQELFRVVELTASEFGRSDVDTAGLFLLFHVDTLQSSIVRDTVDLLMV